MSAIASPTSILKSLLGSNKTFAEHQMVRNVPGWEGFYAQS
jgi:hypothetical protein